MTCHVRVPFPTNRTYSLKRCLDTLPHTATWSIAEANVALICANLPLLRPFLPGKQRFIRLRNFFGSAFSKSSHDRSTNSGRSETFDASPHAQELKPLASTGSRMSGGRFASQSDLGPDHYSPVVQDEILYAAADDPERGLGMDWLKNVHPR